MILAPSYPDTFLHHIHAYHSASVITLIITALNMHATYNTYTRFAKKDDEWAILADESFIPLWCELCNVI